MKRGLSLDNWFFYSFLGFFVLFLLLIWLGHQHIFYLGRAEVVNGSTSEYRDNDLYLLSAIVQSLAALFALGMTASLMVVQLYTEPMVRPYFALVQLRNEKFWAMIIFSLLSIFWNSILLGHVENSISDYDIYIDLGILLALTSFLLVIPYLISSLKRLRVEDTIDMLIRRIK